MKTKYYFLAGLSSLMLGACSNDTEPAVPGNDPSAEGVEAIMNLSLKFPGADSRAVSFEDGTKEESAVKTVTVFYFSKDDHTYLGMGNVVVDAEDVESGDLTNIESKISTSVPANVVKELHGKDKVDIVVVLNEPENFGEGRLTENTSTYSDFNAALEATDDAGFMMTSVNYFPEDEITQQGVETYFTEITPENIVEVGSNGQPINPKAVDVWVERVCSKVTLAKADAGVETPEGVTVDIKKWGLNVRNKVVFPVKSLNGEFNSWTTDQWPGAAHWTNEDAVSRHRSYWAVDPNYTGEAYETDPTAEDYAFKLVKFTELDKAMGETAYCLENTFDNEHQDRDETTTAVVYAQYLPNGLTWEEGEKKTWAMQNGKYLTWSDFVNNFLFEEKIYVLTEKQEEGDGTTVSYTFDNAELNEDIDLTYTEIIDENKTLIGATDYKFALKEGIKLYKHTGKDLPGKEEYIEKGEIDQYFTELKETDMKQLGTSFESLENVSIYTDGYCYYEVRIRHFDETEVPLTTEENGINADDQLGRYGVVRNHCYKLNITSISKPGKPIDSEVVIPERTPDDSKEYAMQVDIQVLKWAVRQQDVEL